MKKIVSLTFLYTVLFPHFSFSQRFSYTRYDIEQGLAGSTLYCITQDKDGFIWAGTQTGVSRFDGTHFKNFTTRDGLPDLEILQIFGESKGRVWMAPFRKSICYYFEGKIHNEQNDSLLSRIHLHHNIESFAEDAAGNILLQERDALHLLNADGSLVQIDSLDHEPVRRCVAVSASSSGHFLAQVGGKIIEFSGKECVRSIPIPFPWAHPNFIAMTPNCAVWKGSDSNFDILSLSAERMISRPFEMRYTRHISFSVIADSLVYKNESSGSLEYNTNTRLTRKFLPGIPVSRAFRDRSGNSWFTTLGQGLFRLNSNEIRTADLAGPNAAKVNVTAITKLGKELLIGNDNNCVFRLSLPDMEVKTRQPFVYSTGGRILFIDTIAKDKILSGSDYGLTEGTRGLQFIREIQGGIKSVARINDRNLLVAFSWGAGILDLPAFRIRDTLWRERSTVVFYHEDTMYIGTLNGLYRSVRDQPFVFLGEKTPFLRRRISSIAESADGTVWIASYDDAGIIGYKDDRQVAAITTDQGLTSDICTTLVTDHNMLWAGTNKGLNRIQLDGPRYRVTQYRARDGLASDMINTLFVDDTVIYVGTPAGLSFFDKKRLAGGEGCLLYLLSLNNSDRERVGDTANLVIPYTDRRVRFEFAGISYRSAGDITYRYRMAALDNTWRETKENFVDYPDLPSGDYEWQLIAVNKFGNQSRMLTVPVTVTIQFWKRTWFALLIWLLSLLLFWWLVSRRISRIRHQQKEKETLMRKMNELENTALKSQMNPHFIFNCLNSIQQSIFSGDTMGANNYIAGLAGLIRMTLNNSSRTFVCIEEEVEYLSSYLALEKLRFKEKIDYEIMVDASIDQRTALIPPMLIQPYVENGIHHGLQHKTAGRGHIGIRIGRNEGMLEVTVEDNGVGRMAPAGRKKFDFKSHAPKGIPLTEDRIGILKALYGKDVGVEIVDLRDDRGEPTGTRILIRLPFVREKDLFF